MLALDFQPQHFETAKQFAIEITPAIGWAGASFGGIAWGVAKVVMR